MIFTELLTEMCESDFFGVITDVSTKIRMCQPKEFLSANKAWNVWFLMIYDRFLDGIKISRRGLKKASEN